MIGESPYLSRGNRATDFDVEIRDNPLMETLSKAYIDKIIDQGIAKYNGIIADFERACGLKKQSIKDIRRQKKIPRADLWQKIAKEMGLEQPIVVEPMEIDKELINTIANDFQKALEKDKVTITPNDLINTAAETYNLIINYRKSDKTISPNAAMASLMLKRKIR